MAMAGVGALFFVMGTKTLHWFKEADFFSIRQTLPEDMDLSDLDFKISESGDKKSVRN